MNISLKSIEKRIRRLELKLKLVLTVEERVILEDMTVFKYYLDKEEGKSPSIPKGTMVPEPMFIKRAEYFKKIVDKNTILLKVFAQKDNYTEKYNIIHNFIDKWYKGGWLKPGRFKAA